VTCLAQKTGLFLDYDVFPPEMAVCVVDLEHSHSGISRRRRA